MEYKHLILAIQKYFKGAGFWYLNKKDKTIRYQVNNLPELANIIIPFFMKHHLRSGKLKSFLYFKWIVEKMRLKIHWKNSDEFISLVVLGSNLNPLGKLGNSIRYLKPEHQKLILSNAHPKTVDISQLNRIVENFKLNPLTLQFIHGIFDGNGSLSVSLLNQQSEKTGMFKISARASFTLVQDIHNLSLLHEIKNYFKQEGNIYKLSDNCVRYNTSNTKSLMHIILPLFSGKQILTPGITTIDEFDISNLNLPLIKYNKIFYTAKLLKANNIGINNESDLNYVITLCYCIFHNKHNISLHDYTKITKNKLFNNNIIEDIV